MICMYIRGTGLLPLEFPSLSNGSRRHGDDGWRHQEQLTGAECCLTQQQAASDSAEVTSGRGQDVCGYGCFWCVDVASGVLSGWPSLGCCLVREVFCVGGS